MEAQGAVMLLCCVVPREQCGAGVDLESLKRMLPQAGPLLEDQTLQVEVKVVGERAPLLRVPAKDDARVLPPTSWEHAWLPMNRVFVVLVIRRAIAPWTVPVVSWVRGALPDPKPTGLELLRVEYQLPPATRQAGAEKAAWKALRKLAETMGLMMPPGLQALRQIVVQHGAVTALLGVPKMQAVQWLRGSGCGGLYLRPFWTAETDASIGRNKFSFLWLRGKAERWPELWNVFKDREGFVGLLFAGRDLALRVSSKANVEQFQAQLGLTLGSAEGKLRQAVSGQRWWRLGPLTEAESWRATDMIRSAGLEPLRGELRYAPMGPWRHAVYFAAVGLPTRRTLDDGSRGCSEAYFQEADPPLQRNRPAANKNTGEALASSSVWAGPRKPPPQASTPSTIHAAASCPEPSASIANKEASAVLKVSQGTGGGPVSSVGRVSGDVKENVRRSELEELRQLIQDLRTELRALRRENELLRRAQVTDPWRAVGQSQPPQCPSTPSGLLALPPPTFSPVPPVAGDVEMEHSSLGLHAREQGATPEAKRTLGAARALVVDGQDDV